MNQPLTVILRRSDGHGRRCEFATTANNAQVLAWIAGRAIALQRGLRELGARNLTAVDYRECELHIEIGNGMPATPMRFREVVFDLSSNALLSVVLCAGIERGPVSTLSLYALDANGLAPMAERTSAAPC